MYQLIIIIVCLLPQHNSDTLEQEELNGIFLTEDYHENCQERKSFEVDEKKYCMTKKPIIGVEDFESVTNIYLDYETLYNALDLHLNESGGEKLKLLSQIFSGRILALIINNRLAGFIKIDRVVENGIIKIYDQERSNNLSWTHKELKNIIDNNKKTTKDENGELQN